MKILSEGNVFRNFDGFSVSKRNDIIELFFENGEWLETTSDHRIYCKEGIKQAKEIKIGDCVVSINGFIEVIYKSKHNRHTRVFDVANVENTHNFYANNVLSHNCDELAFVQNDIAFYRSTYPTIAAGKTTKLIITSTPNGMNLFFKLYTDAKNGKNLFWHYDCLWYKHPDRDEKWKEETIANTSKRQFEIEHECKFLGSTNTLIFSSSLETLTFENPIKQKDGIFIYEMPVKEGIYIGCVDVSEGIQKDFSTIQMIRIDQKPYRQVMTFERNDIGPWFFPSIIYSIGKEYNDAYMLVENNDLGKIVADSLHFDYDYENLLSSSTIKGRDIINEFSMDKVGIRTTKKVKSVGCTTLKTLIEENHFIICDYNTIQQLYSFIKRKNSYAAENGKNDDLVTPLVLFAWATTQTWFEDITDASIQHLVKERREKEAEDSHTLFGFVDDGTTYYLTAM